METQELVRDSWTQEFQKIKISEHVSIQRGDIHRFFSRLFELEQRYQDESLAKYGLKVISTKIVKKQNWPLYEAYLLKVGHAFPNTIQVVVRILETYQLHGYSLNSNAISRFCNSVIRQHAVTDGHSELAWVLWLAVRLRIKLSAESRKHVEATNNSVALLILLDLQDRGLITGKVRKTFLSQFATTETLTSESWLLAYEAGRRCWLGNKNAKFIEVHEHFQHLLKSGVCFYVRDVQTKPLFTLKEKYRDSFEIDWESDEALDRYFDFDEQNLDYADAGTSISDIDDFEIIEEDDDEFDFF